MSLSVNKFLKKNHCKYTTITTTTIQKKSLQKSIFKNNDHRDWDKKKNEKQNKNGVNEWMNERINDCQLILADWLTDWINMIVSFT